MSQKCWMYGPNMRIVVSMRSHQLAGTQSAALRPLLLAGERGRCPQEVPVVRMVKQWIHALRLALSDVGSVRLTRLDVGERCIVIAADADIDVRGHVHQVPGTRGQRAEPVGRSLGALRSRGCLHDVDVEVIGARVIRICPSTRSSTVSISRVAGFGSPFAIQ